MPSTIKFQPTYRNIWYISFPIIFAGISETIVDITDTIFLGRYGITELAAIGLADAIYGVALFLALGLVDGIQIIIGRRAGEENLVEIGRVFNQGLYLLALAAIVLILIIKFLVPPITANIFASADVHGAVNDYLQIASYALLFQSFNLAYSAFYVGISRTKVFIGATIILAVTNIVLDYGLIFGNLGLPELGIKGAAIASLSSEIAVFLFLTFDVMKQHFVKTYGVLHFSQWNSSLSKMLVSISMPVSLEALVGTLKWFLFFVIVEQSGEKTLAGATIIFSCYALFLVPIDAFSETVCSMVSNLLGQQRKKDLVLLIHKTILLCYMIVLPALIFTLGLPEQILSIFTPDDLIIEIANNSLLVILLATVIAIPAETYYSTVAGTGDTRAILAIQIIVTGCFLAFTYYTAFFLALPIEYIWMAEVTGMMVTLLLSWLWFRSGFWKRLKI